MAEQMLSKFSKPAEGVVGRGVATLLATFLVTKNSAGLGGNRKWSVKQRRQRREAVKKLVTTTLTTNGLGK